MHYELIALTATGRAKQAKVAAIGVAGAGQMRFIQPFNEHAQAPGQVDRV